MSPHPSQSRIVILFISVFVAPHCSAQLVPTGGAFFWTDPDAHVQSAAVDAAGNIFLAGYIQTPKLTTTPAVLQPNPVIDCSNDPFCAYGFAAKVAPSGDKLMWATYLGVGGINYPIVIAVAADDSVLVAGSTLSKSFVPPLPGYQSTPAGLFVVRLNADSSSLLAGTYFGGAGTTYPTGGSQADSIAAMKLDSAGNVYIAGDANSIPFPTTPGAYQRDRNSVTRDPCSEGPDHFVAKFDPTLKSLIFSTLIGTAGRNATSDLALGPDSSIYTAGTHGSERSCPTDGVVTRISPDGHTLIYSTALGTSPRGVYALAVDSRGNAFAGSDSRMWTPPWTGSVTEIDAQGKIVNTQSIGGSISAIAAGANGEVAVAGSASPWKLTPTADGPGLCGLGTGYTTESYTARLRAPALEIVYVGFLSGDFLPPTLLGTDRVLTSFPYATLTPFAILPTGPPAPGTVTCLTSAASYKSDAIAPGELVAMFGSKIGPDIPLGMGLDERGDITKSLGGFSASVDGLPAPMLYAGPGQINFVVPFGIRDADQVHVELRRDSTVLSAFDKATQRTWVGLFRADATLTGWDLAVINQDGTPNSASNPAALGGERTVISLYGTGFGAMAPQAMDGARPPLPESTPVANVTVMVNGFPVQVEYVGNAPTLVQGVVQVNIRLPQVFPGWWLDGSAPHRAEVSVMADMGPSADYGFFYIR